MKTERALLRIYAAADETARLSMFLTHPGLRRQFTGIEMAKATQPKVKPSTRNSGLIGWLGLPRSCIKKMAKKVQPPSA